MTTRHYLIATHTEELQYDPAAVLAFLDRNPDVELYGATSDEDRIIAAFYALNGSTYAGEHLFDPTGSVDSGCELVQRDDEL